MNGTGDFMDEIREAAVYGEMDRWLFTDPDCTSLFYPSWVSNGTDVWLAHWREGAWKIGAGLAYKPEEITCWQTIERPDPPTRGTP